MLALVEVVRTALISASHTLLVALAPRPTALSRAPDRRADVLPHVRSLQRGGGPQRAPDRHPPAPPRFTPQLVPDHISDCFWDLPPQALRVLDRRALTILGEIHVWLSAYPCLGPETDVFRWAASRRSDLPASFRTTKRCMPGAHSVQPETYLAHYRDRLFPHWPQEVRSEAFFAWALGDGSCLINSVIIAIRGHEYPRSDIAAVTTQPVLGAATLRAALLLHGILDYEYTNRILGRGDGAHSPAGKLLEGAAPSAYLGLDHAAPLARLLNRDIWVVSPRTPATTNNTAETGRLPSGVQPPDGAPVILTWAPYHAPGTRPSWAPAAPSGYRHFCPVLFADAVACDPVRPFTYPRSNPFQHPREPPPPDLAQLTTPDHPIVLDDDDTPTRPHPRPRPPPTPDHPRGSEAAPTLPPRGPPPPGPPHPAYPSHPVPTGNHDAPGRDDRRHAPCTAPGRPPLGRPQSSPLASVTHTAAATPGPPPPPSSLGGRWPRPNPNPVRRVAPARPRRTPPPQPHTSKPKSIADYFTRLDGPEGGAVPPAPPTTHPPDAPPAPDNKPAIHKFLRVLTHNVRGLYTRKQDTQDLLHRLAPHIAVLTETKLPHAQRRSSFARKGYTDFHTWVSCSDDRRAGVLMAIHHSITLTSPTEFDVVPVPLRGYVLPARITLPSSDPLLVIGMYVPSDDDVVAQQIYDYTSRLLRHADRRGVASIVLGDMNATTSDDARSRHTVYPRDALLRAFCSSNHLHTNTEADYTYTSEDGSARSTIDHILVGQHTTAAFRSTKPVTGRYVGDHVPIFTDLDLSAMRMTLPTLGETLPRTLPLKLLQPPTPSQLDSFQAEVIRRHSPSLLSAIDGLRDRRDALDSTLDSTLPIPHT